MRNKSTIYLSEATRKELGKRVGNSRGSLSSAIGTIVARYVEMVEDLEPELSDQDARAMVWIAADLKRTSLPVSRGDLLPLNTIHRGLVMGAGSDPDELEKTLASLSDAQLMAALDAAEQS